MCFSKDASIISLAVGIIGAILCISLGTATDKIIGLLFGYVALMQAVEYLLWTHQVCDEYNETVSIWGMILNHSQPVILAIAILLFNPNVNKLHVLGIVLVFLAAIIPYSLMFLKDKASHCTLKSEKNDNHLSWKWNGMKYKGLAYSVFIGSLASLFAIGLPKYGIAWACFPFITYGVTATVYSNSIGALWCYFTVFTPLSYYALRKTIL